VVSRFLRRIKDFLKLFIDENFLCGNLMRVFESLEDKEFLEIGFNRWKMLEKLEPMAQLQLHLNRNFARKEAELVDRMEFEKATVLV
jgi:hypothetical protein